MEQGRTIKKIFESELDGSRRRRKPRLRWLEDVEKILCQIKVKRWQEKAVEREKWHSLLKRPRFSEGCGAKQ
jgi:hypothetical protein